MKRWWCRLRGHQWVSGSLYAPKFFVCARCGEPGSWVAGE